MVKKLIRNNVFETNSSSSHSISISDETKDFVLDMITPDSDGKIYLGINEYGWEWFKHNDAKTKADYAALQFIYNEDALDILREVIEDRTGATVIFNFDGYIDHDSHGIVPSTKEELDNFIFNKNSWLFGGNDNIGPRSDFYDVPIISSNGKIVPVKYTHELQIDRIPVKIKFKSYPTNEEIRKNIYNINDEFEIIFRNNSLLYEKPSIIEKISFDDYYELVYDFDFFDFNEKCFYLYKRDNYKVIGKSLESLTNEYRINNYDLFDKKRKELIWNNKDILLRKVTYTINEL